MTPETRHQLRSLDRALLALIDERARLLASVAATDPGRKPAVDDMLRRHEGLFPAQGIAEVFEAIDRHSAGFAQELG
jgi:chorismate mutase